VSAHLPPDVDRDAADERAARLSAYWRANVRLVVLLLVIWFAVSYGCGILFVDQLNAVRLPGTGFKLGFWFAQQGSIYAFVALIFVYVWRMNRLDRRFGVDE
jgi:putative solute:sodium symporter small subunit